MELQLVTVKEETEARTPSVCPVCQEDLPDPAGSPGQIPQCQGCKSFYLEPQNWLAVNREHLVFPTERPYSCSFCPKRFKRASDRRDHERVHTGERPYGCGICGKRFTQSSVLSGHMRIHTGERPFQCGICFKTFNNSSNYRKHQRIHGQPCSDGDKGNDGNECVILSTKKEDDLEEGRLGSNNTSHNLIPTQNGHVSEEVRESESNRSHDPERQTSPCVNVLSQNGQPDERVAHFKRMKLKQDGTSSDCYLEMGQNNQGRSSFGGPRRTDDGEGYAVGLGDDGDHSYDQDESQNGHNFRLVEYIGENHSQGLNQSRGGGSHVQGDQKQPYDNHNGRFQTCGRKDFLHSGGNRSHVHKLSQGGGVGHYLKVLKLNRGESTRVDGKPNGQRECPVDVLTWSLSAESSESRQNGSRGDRANGLRQNGTGHFRELNKGGGANKVHFQGVTKEKIITTKGSSWGYLDQGVDMACKGLSVGITMERDGFEKCSALDRSAGINLWEINGSEEPSSFPDNTSASLGHRSLLNQSDDSTQYWEAEESPSSCLPFQDPEPYDQHSPSSFDSKPFMCFACPKQFRRATDLKEHLRVHTGERPFGCEVCGKRFTQSSALATHRRLHTGEKPFECTVCSRRFNNSSNFAKHRRLHGQDGVGRGGRSGGARMERSASVIS